MITLAAAADQPEFERHRKPTRRGAFLAEMQVLVPWSQLAALMEPHYPKAGNGRLPIRLERMLRIHLPHHWFNLPDSTASTWAESRFLTPPRCASSATCWTSRSPS